MKYVTYDATGALTGYYDQDLQEDHAGAFVEVPDGLAADWPAWRMNAARDGLELLPPVAPADELAAASVDMLNLQLVLIDDGKLAQVEAIIGGMAGDDGARARAYWTKARTARRDNYLVEQLWPAIGYDEAGFNDAWSRAAALNP